MEVEKILRSGYFDNLRLDGTLKSVYDSTGTSLLPHCTFKESLNKSDEAFKHGVAHLRIDLIGECSTDICFGELERMREDRKLQRLTKLASADDIDRYLVAYVDILILKSDYAIPFKVEANGKTEKDIEKLAKTNDILDIFLASLELGKYIVKKYEYSEDWVNIAIVDKVYVEPLFRRSGISSWVHENLGDIINMYSMVFPNGIILTYGDFSKESKERFGMSNEQYNKMLIKHYRQLGYSAITKLTLPGFLINNTIMYKLLV